VLFLRRIVVDRGTTGWRILRQLERRFERRIEWRIQRQLERWLQR